MEQRIKSDIDTYLRQEGQDTGVALNFEKQQKAARTGQPKRKTREGESGFFHISLSIHGLL